MSEPVTELFAELGFDVDEKSLAKAEAGLQGLTKWAQRAINAVEGVGNALARAGAGRLGGVFMSAGQGLREGFAQGMQQGAQQALQAMDVRTPGKAPTPDKEPGKARVTTDERVMANTGWRGLGAVLENIGGIQNAFMAAFAGHQVLSFAHEMMDAASATELTAKRLGLTTKALQELEYAANQSDISKGSFANAMKFLQVNSTKAAQGSKEAAAAFAKLGVATKGADGNARPLDELFEDVTTKFAAIKDPAQQTALAMQIFGRAGAELVPMLQEGGEGLRKFREEAAALGGGLSETLLEDAGAYEKSLKQFQFAFLGVKSAIGNFLLPVLTRLSQGITTLVGRFNELYKKTKLIQTILGVGMVAGLIRVVRWLSLVGTAGMLAWAKTAGGFILLAAAIAGVTLVLEDLYQALTGGKSMIGQWIDEWQGFGAISEAVKTMAAGFDSILASMDRLVKHPAKTMLESLKDVGETWAEPFQQKGEYYTGPDGKQHWRPTTNEADGVMGRAEKGMEERANRPVAKGRGVGADAQGALDIPRAAARGLNAKADAAFGQAKASIFSGKSANSDSPTTNNITINAPTGDGKDIAKHVKRALEKHESERNRKIRRALVPAQEP